ncbi:Methyltransferase type 12 [Oceaniovalibus guishaninsula JLT2003]|uniref:Methyltransferase type 12 n=1 Tax=Oceaniovalibus guishaninsula JLT2003 TaxID=1231392 RepID=K2GKU7_9RHOB|nr:class I SAM-dependent methyltransferase [Oceaniovalibus guishaninsula]EKE43401.1 Methyltransferase type 12 [Oceaniovalibus guishaninsula JLT2003]
MRPWFDVPGDWRKPDSDRSFAIWRCDADGYAGVAPLPPPDVLADHYRIDDYHTHAPAGVTRHRRTTLGFRVLEKLAWFADRGVTGLEDLARDLPPGARVLDMGAGAGDAMLALAAMGHDVTGVEPDPNAASRRADFPLTVHAGTAEAVPDAVPRGAFDLVLCKHVLEHTTDPIAALEQMRGLLRQGGRAVVEVPNADCLDFRMAPLNWQHLGVPRHLTLWTGRSLRAAFDKAGFGAVNLRWRHYRRQVAQSWAAFGRPMIGFYRDRGAYRMTPKERTALYYPLLLALTVAAPARFKYDSICAIATRRD